LVRLGRVQAHANARDFVDSPLVPGERSLGDDGGQDAVSDPLEGDEEAVALRVDLVATVLGYGSA
jgi:hypothetical protein